MMEKNGFLFTPIKTKTCNVRNEINTTVLNTPMPQASSTVQRKTIQKNMLRTFPGKEKHKLNVTCQGETEEDADSSLGLLDDMSALASISAEHSTVQDDQHWKYTNTDIQVENARKLLQKFSNIDSSLATDINKENNANIQNLTDKISIHSYVLPAYLAEEAKKLSTSCLLNKVRTNSVIFEPTEITARSSEVSNVNDSSIKMPLSKSYDGMSFTADEIKAQQNNRDMMAQINEENFLSGSKMAEQLSADEARWPQDHTYTMPEPSTEKQHLEFSCFSGIFGQHDLSVESCAGRKLSVGQYFVRKSGDVGALENHEKIRPSLGFITKSPAKRGILQPLVDSTMPDATTLSGESIKEQIQQHKNNLLTPNATINTSENSIISLSTICAILKKDADKTPRRLVDEILLNQRTKECYQVTRNKPKNEALFNDRKSMPATSAQNLQTKIDGNINPENLAKKLSLDKSENDSKNGTINMKRSPVLFVSNLSIKESESFQDKSKEKLCKEKASRNLTSSFNQDRDFELRVSKSTSPVNNMSSHMPSKISKCSTESYDDLKILVTPQKEATKESDIPNKISPSFSVNEQTETRVDVDEVVIGKDSDQLCNCIVGMTSEANVELVSNSNKWIKYKIRLVDIRGVRDTQCVKVITPQNESFIKPNRKASSKIGVNVTKSCKPIGLVFDIILSHMVTKLQWVIKHMIFVNLEDLELEITCNSEKQELNFECVAENSSKVLPLTLYNKNKVDLPVNLSILRDDEPNIFSIDDKSIKLNKLHDKSTLLLLKARTKFTVYIKCEKLQSTTSSSQRQPEHVENMLVVHIRCNDETTLLRKEVPLYATIGVCEIRIVDTEIPIIVSKHQGKLLNIINSGSVATHVIATVVPSEEHTNAAQEFFVKPNDMFLKAGESDSFFIVYKPQCSDTNSANNERHANIKLVAGNNVHYCAVVGEEKPESEKENFLRCHTPSNTVPLSPVTSPQSVTSSRNSPTSTVSSAAVAENIIPVRTTHAALIWKSVKTGKSEIKEFTIRNTSDNKIKIQLDICDGSKNFKFYGVRQAVNTSMVLAMQRQESKTLAVAFNPYSVGPVAGKITIKHYTRESNNCQQYKIIPLHGYGGYSKVNISGTFRDSSANMWLPLGTLYSETTCLKATFILQNGGDLFSFAAIEVTPKAISPKNTSWSVKPKELILRPKEARQVLIEFSPKKEDYAILEHFEVSHVATVHITHGDEPTRQRIRRLVNKIKESGDLTENENKTFKNIVRPICKIFPGEETMHSLLSIRDSIQNLSDLCTGVQQYEVMLTIEKCTDDTLPVHYDIDESQMFYSLMSDDIDTNEEVGASFFSPLTVENCEIQHSEKEQFIVTPSTLVLNPPVRNEATVTIFSLFKTDQPFQTSLLDPNFSVFPAMGMLPSKSKFPLKIQCSQKINCNMDTVLEIYTENEKVNVPIRVVKQR